MLALSAVAGTAQPACAQSQAAQVPAEPARVRLVPRPRGMYVGSSTGSNFLPGETIADPGWARFGAGLTLSGDVGFAFGNGLRLEVEANYRDNPLNRVRLDGVTTTASGRQKTFGSLVNVVYDLPLLGWITPYVAVGGGYVWTGLEKTRFPGPQGTSVIQINDPLGGFAFQGIGGMAVPVPGVSGLAITAEYRFTDVVGHKSFEGSSTVPGGIVPARVTVGNNLNHAVLLGVRYSFGGP